MPDAKCVGQATGIKQQPVTQTRPRPLTVGVVIGVSASFAIALASVALFIGGESSVRSYFRTRINSELGHSLSVAPADLFGPELHRSYEIVSMKSLLGISGAALAAIAAVTALSASLAARLFFALAAVLAISIVMLQFVHFDLLPGTTTAFGGAGVIGLATACASLFRPQVNTYAKIKREPSEAA